MPDLAAGERKHRGVRHPGMAGEREGDAVGCLGAGEDSATGGEVGQGEVREGPGSGDFRQDPGSLWAQETTGDRRWQGGGNDGDFGAKPAAPAGDAGFGFVLGEDVSGFKTGVAAQISEA